jgi:hypothetical protein
MSVYNPILSKIIEKTRERPTNIFKMIPKFLIILWKLFGFVWQKHKKKKEENKHC